MRLFKGVTGGNPDCEVKPTSDTAFQKGRFRINAEACAPAVKAAPDLFAELSVDDETKPFPRSKLGAVPYAIEASHAVEATRAVTAMNATNAATAASAAAASGALETRLAALDARVRAVESPSLKVTRPLPGAMVSWTLGGGRTVDASKVDTYWQAGTAVADVTASPPEITITFASPFPNGVIAQFATSANANTGSTPAMLVDDAGDVRGFRIRLNGAAMPGKYRVNWLALGW